MRGTGAEVEHDGDAFRVRCAVCGDIANVPTLDEGLEVAARDDRASRHDDDFGEISPR